MRKVIFLDIDNTLLDFDECSRTAIRQGLLERGVAWHDDMFDTFNTVNNGLWQRLERGELTQSGLYDIRFGLVFEAMGVELDGHEFERYFRVQLHELAIPVDGAEALMKELSGRYVLCAASNGPHGQQVNRLRNASLLPYFTEVFTSERMGFSKPDPAFYDACLAVLGVRAEECCMVGDSLTADVAGAVAYGMEAVWFDPQGREAPAELGGIPRAETLAAVAELLT